MSNYWDDILGTKTEAIKTEKIQNTQKNENYWDDVLGTKTVIENNQEEKKESLNDRIWGKVGEYAEKLEIIGENTPKKNIQSHIQDKPFQFGGGKIEKGVGNTWDETELRKQRQESRWEKFKLLGEINKQNIPEIALNTPSGQGSTLLDSSHKKVALDTSSTFKQSTAGVISSIGSATEVMGNQIDSKALASWGEKVADNYRGIVIANPQWESKAKKWGEGGGLDPQFYIDTVGELIPTVLGVMGMATVGTLIGGPVGGGATTYAFTSSLETGNAYQRFIDAGLTIEQATNASQAYGAVAGALEAIVPLGLTKIIGKPASEIIKKSFLKNLFKELPKIVLTEGTTEGVQQFTENLALSWYKENVDLFDGVVEAFVKGMVGGVAFGGLGSSLQMLPSVNVDLQKQATMASKNPTKETVKIIEEAKHDFKEKTIPFISNEEFKVEIIPFNDGTFQSQGKIKIGQKELISPARESFQTYQEAVSGQIQELKNFAESEIAKTQDSQDLVNLKRVDEMLEEISTVEKINKYVDKKIDELNEESVSKEMTQEEKESLMEKIQDDQPVMETFDAMLEKSVKKSKNQVKAVNFSKKSQKVLGQFAKKNDLALKEKKLEKKIDQLAGLKKSILGRKTEKRNRYLLDSNAKVVKWEREISVLKREISRKENVLNDKNIKQLPEFKKIKTEMRELEKSVLEFYNEHLKGFAKATGFKGTNEDAFLSFISGKEFEQEAFEQFNTYISQKKEYENIKSNLVKSLESEIDNQRKIRENASRKRKNQKEDRQSEEDGKEGGGEDKQKNFTKLKKINSLKRKDYKTEKEWKVAQLEKLEEIEKSWDNDDEIYASGAKPRVKNKAKPQKTNIEDSISFQDDDVAFRKKIKDSIENFYVAIKDEMHAINRVFGEESNVMKKIRNFAGAAKRAEEMLVGEGTFNYQNWETNGESLRNIIKDISPEKERDLQSYLIFRREKSLQEIKPDYKSTLDLKEVKAKIQELEKNYPDMKELGNRIRDFNNRVFQYAVDSGFISEDVARAIRKENPDYTAPMFRDVKKNKSGFLSGSIGKVVNPIKRIGGTLEADLKILPALENIIKNTYHVLDAVNKNEIKQDMVKALEKNKDFEKFIKPTKPKVVPVGQSTFTAIYDAEYETKLIKFAKKLGLKHFEAKGKVGSNLGYYSSAGQLINRKIGTGRETVSHEVGHFLDNKYNLRKNFYKKGLSKAVGEEIFQHSVRKGESTNRLGMVAERFANAFSWWLSQRYLAKRDLPLFSKAMENLIRNNPELKPLLSIEPTPMPSLESGVETIFAIATRQPDGIIDVRIDGQTKYYEVDMDIYKALMGFDKQQSNIFVNLLAVPTRWLRAGATLTPEFTLRNPLRDQLTAAINSNNGYIPFVDLARGVYKMISKKPSNIELNRLYRISGADYASIVSPDRAEMETALRDVIKGRGATYYVKHPIDFLRVLAEYGETGTRLAEFEKEFKKGGKNKDSVISAGAVARDLTLNFGKMGTKGKVINRIVAFFNAQLEDIDKIVRQHKKYPARTVFKAITYVTLPTILLWFLNRDNEDYKELSQWRKDLFWNIPLGGKKIKFIAIPKPFGYGTIYGTFTEKILNTMDTGSTKKGFNGFGETLMNSFMPSVMPTAFLPPIEDFANRSYFLNRKLVPTNKENLIPELQYGRYTAESAKFLGKMFDYSPAKIENLIRGYTGGLGGYGLQAGDQLVGLFNDLPEKADRGLSSFPVLKAFLVDKPVGSRSNSVNDFYDIADKSNRALKSYNEMKNFDSERAEKYLDKNADYIAIAKRINSMRQSISLLYKSRDAVLESKKLNGKEKGEKLDAIDTEILEMAKSFLKEIKGSENFTPQQAKVMSFSQTDNVEMAQEFLKLNKKEQTDVLKLFTKNRRSALQKGKEEILLKEYVLKKGLTSRLANELVREAIGETKDASSKQRATNLKKEFRIFREFGYENDLVNSLINAKSNEDKAKILKGEKARVGQIKFSSFVAKARRLGLVSDDTYKKFKKL